MERNKDLQLNMYERFSAAILDTIAQKFGGKTADPLRALIHSFMDYTSTKRWVTVTHRYSSSVCDVLQDLGFVDDNGGVTKTYVMRNPDDLVHSVNLIHVRWSDIPNTDYSFCEIKSLIGSFDSVDTHSDHIPKTIANAVKMNPELMRVLMEKMVDNPDEIILPDGFVFPELMKEHYGLMAYAVMELNGSYHTSYMAATGFLRDPDGMFCRAGLGGEGFITSDPESYFGFVVVKDRGPTLVIYSKKPIRENNCVYAIGYFVNTHGNLDEAARVYPQLIGSQMAPVIADFRRDLEELKSLNIAEGFQC